MILRLDSLHSRRMSNLEIHRDTGEVGVPTAAGTAPELHDDGPPALEPGAIVDHFKVMRLVARGGMGEIYLARDTKLGRKVALKLVRLEQLNPSAVERFLDEARVTATFSHPHIVTIHAAGEHEHQPYVALEYLEGVTLRQRMTEDAPGQRDGQRFGLAIAQALAEAHRHRVLHLDLKPENVIIPKDGRLRVVDFGLARLTGADPVPSTVPAKFDDQTHASRIFGTPMYMAPETWLQREPSTATDIWALGIILFELFEGAHPYAYVASPFELVQLLSHEEDPPPEFSRAREVPDELSDLVRSCLAKNAARRPSAAEVALQLEALLTRGKMAPRSSEERNPFRGLEAFAERHADFFFGRSAEIASFAERLRDTPIMPIVGRSGAGKSSFVQAGVMPRLREQGNWVLIQLRPGSQPLRQLAAKVVATDATSRRAETNALLTTGPQDVSSAQRAFADSLLENPALLGLHLMERAETEGCRIVLFIDQLEEVCTLVEDPRQRTAFLQAICAAADDAQLPIRVIFTVRDDFISRLAETPEMRDVLSRVTVLQSPDGAALEEIVSAPLSAVGYGFEDEALPREMIAAVRGEQASLPLLQFTLHLLWERRDNKRKLLTRAAYGEIGGVAGALAAHADLVLTGLSEQELGFVREIALRLVTPEGTRRVLSRRRALEGLAPESASVLDRLTQSRLVAARQASTGVEIELAHESLVRTWSRLARWLEESREEVVFLAEVGQAADLWEKRGRRDEEVWTGESLREAHRTLQHLQAKIPRHIGEFLAASERYVNAREALERRQHAGAQCESARAALARGGMVQARAQLRTALETDDSSLARALWWQLAQHPLLWQRNVGGSVTHIAFAPDGTVAAASDLCIILFDPKTARMRVLRGHDDNVVSLAFSNDGKTLISGTWSGKLGRWDLAAGTVKVQKPHTDSVWRVFYSPDGKWVATASVDKLVKLWDAETFTEKLTLSGHEGGVYGLAWAPDSQSLMSGGHDKTVRRWALDGTCTQVITTRGTSVRDVSIAPDGQSFVTGDLDGVVRLYDQAGHETGSLFGHTHPLHRVCYRPDGKELASSSVDQTIRLWDLGTMREKRVLTGHQSLIRGLAYSADGTVLASGSYDQTVRLWDLTASQQAHVALHHEAGIEGLSFAPNGLWIATGSQDKTVRIWDVSTGHVRSVLRGHEGNIGNVAFSSDSAWLASAGNDGTARVWDAESGRELMRFTAFGDRMAAVAFSPDKKWLAAGAGDGSVRVWDLHTRSERHLLRAHPADCRWVEFSPDGLELVTTAHDDDTIRFWNLESGEQTRALRGHEHGVVGVGFSPDRTLLVSAGFDNTVRVWNLADGQGRIVGKHDSRCYKAMFHPDGKRVLTASADGTVGLWRLDGGESRRFVGHRSEVNAARLSPDGRLVVSSSDDATVRLFDTETGEPVWRWRGSFADGPQIDTHLGWQRFDGRASPEAAWRRAVTAGVQSSEQGTHVAVLTRSSVELWDRKTDTRVIAREMAPRELEKIKKVMAVPAGVVILAQGATLVTAAKEKKLASDVSAVTFDMQEILLVADKTILRFTPDGVPCGSFTADRGVSAVARMGGWIVCGYDNGMVELISLLDGTRPGMSFEETPTSRVVFLFAGPMDTIIAGYENGAFGLWSLHSGTLLHRDRLHGSIASLMRSGGALYAASELGDFSCVDLSAFEADYATVLAAVRARIPVRWEDGIAVPA